METTLAFSITDARSIAVNTRTLYAPLTGQQRYTRELVERFLPVIRTVRPAQSLLGIKGHAWEQIVLPHLVKSSLLWSPSTTGPLSVSNQVVTVHDVSPLDHPEWFAPRFASWYRFMVPRLVKKVRRVIAISEFTRERLLEITGVHPDKIVTVYNGVSPKFAPQSNDVHAEVREQLKLPTPRYILSLSSIEPRKNLWRLLDAWWAVNSSLPEDVWLVIAGAQGRAELFQQVVFGALPPRVFFTGAVPENLLPGLYSGAIALAYVSQYEGFGLPLVEAMAAGTPAITSNCTSMPEVIGDAGIIIDPHDPNAIAEGIRTVVKIESLRATLSQRGLERARQFSWDRTAMLTLRVLTEAAN